MNKHPLNIYELDGNGPLFRQINRAISRPILSGRNAPGTRLPSEHAFMEMFSTSRMTVNRALQLLADDGLVTRHRRSGTFVANQVVEHSVIELKDIVDEVEASGALYEYQLLDLKTVTANAELSKKLGTKKKAMLLYILCRHYSDKKPILIEQRYINISAAPKCLDESFSNTPPGHWLIKNVPWSIAEHIISALNATDTIAKYLEIKLGDACLSVDRTTWHDGGQDGEKITFVTLTYPGDKHRLISRFTPGQ